MKVLGWIIGLVALLIVAIGAYVVMNSGALLERAVESYGGQYLGAPVEVAEATVSLSDGSAAISGLVIENPPGFTGPPAFRLDNIAMVLDTDQLSRDLVVLREITIDGADVTALVEGRESNLGAIMEHLNAQIAAEEQAEEGDEVKLIIDRLDFTGARASVESDVLGQGSVDIPDVHLTDVGRDSGGATVGEVLKQVLEPMIRAVTRRLLEQGVDLEGARERIEQNVRERADEAVGGGLDRLRNAVRPETQEEGASEPRAQDQQ